MPQKRDGEGLAEEAPTHSGLDICMYMFICTYTCLVVSPNLHIEQETLQMRGGGLAFATKHMCMFADIYMRMHINIGMYKVYI